jgi:gamma-glutamyltranspeptidase/glutathione hydrolase
MTILNKVTFFICATVLSASCSIPDKEPQTTGVLGSKGMVVSAHPEASEIGLAILKKGGNAMDAACAVEFALSVCYPAAGNIAGGGFWVVYTSGKRVHTLDYREKAPSGAHKDMFLDPDGEVIKGLSTQTLLASGVPGTVAGMVKAHEKFGSLPWSEIVQPSIDLARNGFAITTNQAADFNSIRQSLIERNTWIIPLVHDSAWKAGDLLVQPELAATLERIRDHKRDGFYSGPTADLIVAQMKESGGVITHQDLADYDAVWREPISGEYKEYTFYSMAPPSSGGVALKQLLGLTAMKAMTESGHNAAQTVHLMAEAEKIVYADRSEFLGDPNFTKVPVEYLTSSSYLRKRATEINPENANPSETVKAGSIPAESEETTHYSVTDQWGNAVSATTTLNGGYGNRIMVKGAGFLMNNQMDDFSVKPGYPNLYGLLGSEANSIQPGKRMLSSMTPTILTKDNALFMVVGTPGGSTIITSVYQTILNVTDFGMTMQEAVSAKRFHHQWLPDVIQYEPEAFDSVTVKRLESMGQHLKKVGKIGRVDAILVRPDKKFEGGADPRGDDTAKGF